MSKIRGAIFYLYYSSSLQILLLSLRWMEKVGLEVMATCGNPPEVKGQRIREVHVFTSCPEIRSPPDSEVVVATGPPKLNKHKIGISKGFGSKAKPVKPKAKQLKTTKRRPQVKPTGPKVTKKKKTP